MKTEKERKGAEAPDVGVTASAPTPIREAGRLGAVRGICPLLSLNSPHGQCVCLGEKCAWYDDEIGACALVSIANLLNFMEMAIEKLPDSLEKKVRSD